MSNILPAIRKIVEESQPHEWYRWQNSYLWTSYELKIGNGYSVSLNRWQDAGICMVTGKLSGRDFNFNINHDRTDVEKEWTELHFNRIHDAFKEADYQIYRKKEEAEAKGLRSAVENYKKNNYKEEHSWLWKLWKGIFG